jgi:hypothetical protein
LETGTVLDGEVKDKTFYPFEVLALGDVSLLQDTVEERVAQARYLCQAHAGLWLFEPPTLDWVKGLKQHEPVWEGFVAKKKGCPYVPLGSEAQESRTWLKLRW